MYATQYLDRLGLDIAADERAIKRAYARELKQIDQETDAAGFQALRHAYEMALQWVQHKPANVSFAPAAAVPVLPAAVPEFKTHTRAAPARDAETGENPAELGQIVFNEFLAICGEMAAQGDARDALLWRKHLQRCANDDRLLNITARAHFEFFVARLLADGWQSGHEGLFVAARQVFAWETDRRRLMEFGQLGAWISQAIDECEMYNHQHSGDCSGQADAVARVRDDRAPKTGELIKHVPHLYNMATRFPAWTAIIADTERIKQWMALEQAIPKWRRKMRFTKGASGSGWNFDLSWWKVVLLVVAIRALLSSFGSAPPSNQPPWKPPQVDQPYRPQLDQPYKPPLSAREQEEELLYQRAAGTLYMPPGTRTLDPQAQREQAANGAVLPAPARPTGRFLNDAEMKAISKRIKFQWPETAKGTYKVEFRIELDERGAIAKMKTESPSGLPELDRRIEEAIRASAPFDAQISRNFGIKYTASYAPAKKKARVPAVAPPGEPKPVEAPPEEPTPAAAA